MNPEKLKIIFETLGMVVVLAPVVLFTVLGVSSILGRPLAERPIGRCVQLSVLAGLSSALIILGLMLSTNTYHVPINLGSWVKIPHYHFEVKFIFDRLSVPFLILTYILCGTIGAFAIRYMHRERGFNRFFTMYALFMMGMTITSLSGTIETLFAGWEMVGLSSAMLVAFFHDRPSPCSNGLRVWTVYRISDAALLIASVFIHQFTGDGDFDKVLGSGIWPNGHLDLTGAFAINGNQALLIGSLMLLAAVGKSALVPFSGWLPRAMEGPTPSSAVFYGALSVHLGAFLLLRMSPLMEHSPALRVLIISAGLITAAFAAFAERVQTDIKCALSFASLTQVGLIVAEIGCGFYYVALIHILGHGCFRTLQFVRAPTLLHDYHTIENAIGDRLPKNQDRLKGYLSSQWSAWFYRLALERGYLDSYLTDYLVYPFLRLLRGCDALERRWTDFLSGGVSRESELIESPNGTFEELL